jgi:hypothetical protein
METGMPKSLTCKRTAMTEDLNQTILEPRTDNTKMGEIIRTRIKDAVVKKKFSNPRCSSGEPLSVYKLCDPSNCCRINNHEKR